MKDGYDNLENNRPWPKLLYAPHFKANSFYSTTNTKLQILTNYSKLWADNKLHKWHFVVRGKKTNVMSIAVLKKEKLRVVTSSRSSNTWRH